MTGYTIIPERLAELDRVHLARGSHTSYDAGRCGMEEVAYLAGNDITSAPPCASHVLRAYTIGLNDGWDDEQRQTLKPYLPRMIGTAGDGQDEARSYLALDWLIRSFAPAWLDLAGLTAAAQELRDLRRIVDMVSAEAAGPVVRAARTRAAAAGDAAWDAAGTAWDAAGTAGVAEVAARDAAGTAARAAAGTAAWDAWDAARAAWDAARAGARVAARDAGTAWVAARVAARDAGAAGVAARVAARAALRPTVEALQASALDLLDHMINPSAVTR